MTVLAHLKPHSRFKLPLVKWVFTCLNPPKTPCFSDTGELNTESEQGKHYQLFQTQE